MTVHVYCYIPVHQAIAHGEEKEKRKLKVAKKAPARVNLFFQVGFAQGSIQSTSPNLLQADIGRKGKIFLRPETGKIGN